MPADPVKDIREATTRVFNDEPAVKLLRGMERAGDSIMREVDHMRRRLSDAKKRAIKRLLGQ